MPAKAHSTGLAMLPLESARLVLRRMRPGDLQPFLEYRNDARIARFQGWQAFTGRAALAFLKKQESQEPLLPGQWLQIAITLKPAQALIGDCALKIHAADPRQATIGITLSRRFQGSGFALEAASALLNYLFDELRLHRVMADTDPRNAPAWRLLERLSFRREGHLKKSLWFKGRWADEYLYGILAREWRSHRRTLRQGPAVRRMLHKKTCLHFNSCRKA